jgi:quercetin dioxygenase-like cupin family protein
MTTHAGHGHHLAAGQGEAIWFLDTLTTVKASGRDTNDALSVVEVLCPAGFGPPPHLHHRDDEAFYVLDGQMTVTCGEQTWTAAPGSFVLLPRGIPHAFTVAATGPCRVLTINTPAGFERFVAEAGRPASQLTLPSPQPPDVPTLLALAPKYGHEYVPGPAVGETQSQPGATTPTATGPSAPAG